MAHIRTGSRRRAQKERERRERQAEKDRIAAEAVARDKEAVAKTESVERRVAELENLLRSSLTRDPRISFDSLRITAAIPPLDLGSLADPIPEPQWADFAPSHQRPAADAGRPPALPGFIRGGRAGVR